MDEDFRARLAATLPKLPPYRINSRGYLQEWIEDWTGGTEGHNISPNFPLFPGSTITLRGNPELAGAISKWMETRQARGGWITAWDASVWARLERGEKVRAMAPGLSYQFPRRQPAQSKEQPVRRQFRPDRRHCRSFASKPRRRNQPAARFATLVVGRFRPGTARTRRL